MQWIVSLGMLIGIMITGATLAVADDEGDVRYPFLNTNDQQRRAIENGAEPPLVVLRRLGIRAVARPEDVGYHLAKFYDEKGWFFYGVEMSLDGEAIGRDNIGVKIRYPRLRMGDLVPMFNRMYRVEHWSSEDGLVSSSGMPVVWKPDSILPEDLVVARDSIVIPLKGKAFPGREEYVDQDVPRLPTYEGGQTTINADVPEGWKSWDPSFDHYSSMFRLLEIEGDDDGKLVAVIKMNDGGRITFVRDWITIRVRVGDVIDGGPFRHEILKIIPPKGEREGKWRTQDDEYTLCGWVEMSLEDVPPPQERLLAASDTESGAGTGSASPDLPPSDGSEVPGVNTTSPDAPGMPATSSTSARPFRILLWLALVVLALGGAVVLLRGQKRTQA